MKLSTTTTQTSKLYPDVTFTFYKATEARRLKFSSATADARYKLRELMAEINAIKVPEEGKELDPVTAAKVTNLNDALMLLVDRDIKPRWLDVYLKSVTGLEIDDVVATVETFTENAPAELYDEAVNFIRDQAELSPAEKKV